MIAGEVGQRKRTKRLSSRFYIGITKMVSNNGNKNTKFGVYKSLCCGYEIVIGADITFPDCPKHLKLPTEWKLVLEAEDQVLHVDDIKERKKNHTAA